MSKRILLVEDEPGLVLTLTDRLTADGYQVESVGDGKLAVERATIITGKRTVLEYLLKPILSAKTNALKE